jgi:hypothetical protein
MPNHLVQAFVSGEDARFFQHKGLDYLAIVRALLRNVFSGEIVQGGSTITQQVVKSLLLSPEKSFGRKIREAILAYRIEKYLTKEEILFLYLNQIYLGHGSYGIAAAAENYFGKQTENFKVLLITSILNTAHREIATGKAGGGGEWSHRSLGAVQLLSQSRQPARRIQKPAEDFPLIHHWIDFQHKYS